MRNDQEITVLEQVRDAEMLLNNWSRNLILKQRSLRPLRDAVRKFSPWRNRSATRIWNLFLVRFFPSLFSSPNLPILDYCSQIHFRFRYPAYVLKNLTQNNSKSQRKDLRNSSIQPNSRTTFKFKNTYQEHQLSNSFRTNSHWNKHVWHVSERTQRYESLTYLVGLNPWQNPHENLQEIDESLLLLLFSPLLFSSLKTLTLFPKA